MELAKANIEMLKMALKSICILIKLEKVVFNFSREIRKQET